MRQITYSSKESKYVQFNFHRPKSIDTLVQALIAGKPRAFILSGDTGAGRSYLLESAVHQATERGRRIQLGRIILDADESDAGSLIDSIQTTSEVLGKKPNQRLLDALKLQVRFQVLPFFFTSLLSLSLSLDLPASRILRLLHAGDEIRGPEKSRRRVLKELLDDLTNKSILVVHLPRPFERNPELSGWLAEEIVKRNDLFLAVSCPPGVEDTAALPYVETIERIEVSPLRPDEVKAVFEGRFPGLEMPAVVSRFLTDYSSGKAPGLAVAADDLLQEDVLIQSNGVWQMTEDARAWRGTGSRFEADLWELVKKAGEFDEGSETATRNLERFLKLAVLTGDAVPSDALLAYLDLLREEEEQLIDLIDDCLTGVSLHLFRDLEYRHPSFPGEAVYAFADSAYRWALVAHFGSSLNDLVRPFFDFLAVHWKTLTRGRARILARLAERLGDNAREEWTRCLEWWIGQDEADELIQNLEHLMRSGSLPPAVLWRTIEATKRSWPDYRRLALLEAYGRQPDGIPHDMLNSFLYERGWINLRLGDYLKAEQNALAGLRSEEAKIRFQILLGYIRLRQGRLLEAGTLAESTVDGLQRRDLEKASAFALRGSIRQALGRYADARSDQEEAREIRLEILGEEHPDTLTSMNNLAATLEAQGDAEGARRLQEQVLEVRRRVLGEEHPDTLTSMGNLALTLKAQGDAEGARRLEEQVLEVSRRVLGEEHPDTLTSMNNLGATLEAQGDAEGARRLHEQVLEVRRRVLGEEHPDTLSSMNNLAATLEAQGDAEGARRLHEQVLEVMRRVLGRSTTPR